MVFSVNEIIDIVIMTLAIGYIFSTFIKREPSEGYDPIKYFSNNNLIEDIKYGIIVAAPAVVLHEIAHKFAAMSFGAIAILKAPINWYIIVVIMRMLNFPFLFFVGGYVAHSPLPPLESMVVSFAGPGTNLVMYLAGYFALKHKKIPRKWVRTVEISTRLNLFLFGFNMIPLPGFDGFNLIKSFFALF